MSRAEAIYQGGMMKMRRHYFISNNLDDLELFEEQLEAAGVSTPQIHVLSRDDAEVERHRHLHEVQSFMKRDVVHATKRGAAIGFCGFSLVLGGAHFSGMTQTAAGWVPFIFLAVIVLGFCAWEGGLLGIERPNRNFARFEQALNEGKHVFFVDLEPRQEAVLESVLKSHPQVRLSGTDSSSVPHWLVSLQQRWGMIRHS